MKTLTPEMKQTLADFILFESNLNKYSFAKDFATIIGEHSEDYRTEETQEYLHPIKQFLQDVLLGGCISGIVGEFIYDSDCKDFYIKHLDDLEAYKTELEEELGETIANRYQAPHYTFIVWLAFEEFCRDYEFKFSLI